MWDEIYTRLKPEIENGNIYVERGNTAQSPPAAPETPRVASSTVSEKNNGPPLPEDAPGTSLSAGPKPVGAQEPPGTQYIKIRLTDRVLFDSGDDQIKGDGIEVLSRLGTILRDEQNLTILIQGHTDNVQIRERLRVRFPDNMALSKSRAMNTAKIIQRSGVSSDSIRLEWFGESRPISGNDSEEGRRKNRRVEIMIVPK